MSQSPDHLGKTMRAAHEAAENHRGAEIVKPGELIDVSYAGGASPSLAARKILNLLIAKAAGDAWQTRTHTITKRELRGAHESNDRIPAILDELMNVRFKVWTLSRAGKSARLTAALIAWNIEETDDDQASIVEWEFTEPARKVFQGSDHWAVLNRAALLNFDSKYSITLYEMGAKRCNLHAPIWRGSAEELRSVLGVPTGSYRNYKDLRRYCLEKAKAEIDQLAHFTLTWTEKRRGMKITEVELQFYKKAEAAIDDAARELARPRAGRKARREGTVEAVIPALPAFGRTRRNLDG